MVLANGDGTTLDGDAFIEVEIADGALEPNEALAVDIEFERDRNKSKKSKKSFKSEKSVKSQ